MNRTRKNILILTYWSYNDALIQAYTLPYVHIIRENISFNSKVYLITFEQDKIRLNANTKAQVKARLKLQGIKLLTFPYFKFGILSILVWLFTSIRLITLILFNRIDYIHAWCTPAGSFGYFLSKITGRKLIIDSYEPHAESMIENNTWKKDSIQFKLLFYLEKKLTQHASIIISTTSAMREYAKNKYDTVLNRFYVKPACVDMKKFDSRKRKNPELLRQLKIEDKIVCVYAGKFGGIYLTKEVFHFFKVASDFWGDKFRVLLLTNHDKNELIEWSKEFNFDPNKMILKFVPHSEVPDYMGLGDFGITPVKPIPTKRYCTPIKDGEYWALGLPVVIPFNISDDSEIIEMNHIGAVMNDFKKEDFEKAVHEIDFLLHQNGKMNEKITAIARNYRDYSIARNLYRHIYGNA